MSYFALLSKSVIVPIAAALFVCVCVSYFRYHRLHIKKISPVKNDVCRFQYLPSKYVTAKIVLHDLDLLFEGKST